MISFRTVSNRRIDLEHLAPSDVQIEDIACALARCCRFAGHIRQHYSVAQHSLMVAYLSPRKLRFAALLHDASEAYLGDLSRHLKHSNYLNGYRVLEERVTDAIEKRFAIRLTPAERDAIKTADNMAACFEHITLRLDHPFTEKEMAQLLQERFVHDTFEDLAALIPLLPIGVAPQDIKQVELEFLLAFTRYGNENLARP